MIRKGTKARPPLSYEAISTSARLDPVVKNSFNFQRDISDLYANTSISGLKKRTRSQPADQQAMLMGDINIVGPTPARATQTANFSEKVGGPRAATAFTSRAQLASNRNDNQINTQGTFQGLAILTQVGTTTAISIAASTLQIGDLTLNYNSGTTDPGAFGAYFIYVDDPNFRGGAVTYQNTLLPATVAAKLGRVYFGRITTVAAGGGSGGGGGSSGGRLIL